MGLTKLPNGWEVATDAAGNVTGRAQFSDDGTRRYVLIRRWGHAFEGQIEGVMPLTWVMLNPSTAGAADDDPTIRKCVGYAKRWGYGGIRVLNLFDLISTDPAGLRGVHEPSSAENDATWQTWLVPWSGGSWSALDVRPDVIVAWGDGASVPVAGHPGVLRDRDQWAARMFVQAGIEPTCLGVTASGQPRHPGRTSYDLERVPWKVL